MSKTTLKDNDRVSDINSFQRVRTETKTFVILANSVKFGRRCIGGRELVLKNGNLTGLGSWFRPVSDHGHGEITLEECQYEDGTAPKILDIVEVEVCGKATDAYQTENYQIDDNYYWVKKGTISEKALLEMEEFPPNLWLDSGYPTDRMRPTAYMNLLDKRSLCLIRPENLRIKIWTEFNQFSGYRTRKRRALFHYRNVSYNLAITDPLLAEKYFDNFPKEGEPCRSFSLNCGDNCLIMLCLGPEFNGYHYKIAASFIELD